MLSTLALLFSLALPQDAGTARDAFLEGWFQETAEGDLEAALKAYRACVERGGAADAPLVAKAKLRMARIAGARGDREAERALLSEVTERFAGTPVAVEAAAALEAGTGTGTGTADAAVAEARAFLDEMLGDGNRVTPAKANVVLRTLSTEEILERHTLKGGSLYSVVKVVNDPSLVEELVLLATTAVDLTHVAYEAIGQIERIRGERPVPEALIEYAATTSEYPAWRVVRQLAQSGQTQELLRVLETNPSLAARVGGGDAHEAIERMVAEGSPQSADVVEKLVGWMRDADQNLGQRIPHEALGADTPVGERLRSLFPTWPAKQRDQVAGHAYAHAKENGASRALLDLFLADPEPTVRGYAHLLLMESDDPDRRREGFERFAAQPRPIDVGGLYNSLNHHDHPRWREVIALLPAGSLRECAYSALLLTSHRAPAEVIAVGLERGDPELITALFRPQWWRDDALQFNGLAPSPPAATLNYPNISRLRESFSAHPDASLFRRLAKAALASPDEEVRRGMTELAGAFKRDRAFHGVPDLVAADPSASIRLRALHRLPFEAFGPDARADLLLDPDPAVASRAIAECNDDDALIAAGERAGPERLVALARRAINGRQGRAVAGLYPRLPTDHDVAATALWVLAERDVEVVLAALDRGDALPSEVSEAARGILGQLPLPEDLRKLLLSRPADRAAVESLAGSVRARREVVVAAFRADRLEDVRTHTFAQSPKPARALADHLVELEGVELARELVRGTSERPVEVGGLALAALGETEALREAFSAAAYPGYFLVPALAAGLDDELFAAVESGRLEPAAVMKAALEQGRPDVVAGVLLGPEDAPRRIFLDPNSSTPHTVLSAAIDHLVRERAVDRLATMVLLYDSADAVRALFQLEAYDRILSDLGTWASHPRGEAMQELKRRTGVPEGRLVWPGYREEQEQMIEAWKARLNT